MKPTPEFERHHEVDAPRVDGRAFRTAFRVRTRLDSLLAAERITPGEWQASVEFRASSAIARGLSGPPAFLARVPGSPDPDGGAVARLSAGLKVSLVEATIGTLATALVTACVIEDLPWAAVARICHRNPETVRDWTVHAIRALAAAWADAQAARDRPPLPRHPERARRRVAAS